MGCREGGRRAGRRDREGGRGSGRGDGEQGGWTGIRDGGRGAGRGDGDQGGWGAFSEGGERTHATRPDDHAGPLVHLDVVLHLQSPTRRPISTPFLSLLQLLQKAEAARNQHRCAHRTV